ncbi:MAG: cyclic nucleotide-binding domain-containing protein [Candidatus Latescibacterota bacterium]|nr:cyclic nucleotide-binding domain-containing protein [Candidatus Latescibacterota bacterium]
MDEEQNGARRTIDPEWENYFNEEKVRARDSLERLLAQVPVFSLLHARELRQMARIVHVRHFARGEVIIRRGVQQSGFYLIRHGSVNIVRESVDGPPQVVGTLHPSELLGEFALLDDTPRSTNIVAGEPSELIGFFKPDLMDIVATRPETGCMILLRLAEEMTCTLNNDYQRLREMGYPFAESDEGDALDLTTV